MTCACTSRPFCVNLIFTPRREATEVRFWISNVQTLPSFSKKVVKGSHGTPPAFLPGTPSYRAVTFVTIASSMFRATVVTDPKGFGTTTLS